MPAKPLDIVAALSLCVQTPGSDGLLGLPVLLLGNPGVGKTARVNAVAAVLGYKIETILASLRGPEDFLGLPLRVGSDLAPSTVYAPPKWTRDLIALNPQDIEFYTMRRRIDGSIPVGTPKPGALPGSPGIITPPTRSILFLDELGTAFGRTMAALLRVLHERVVGDIALPGTTAMVAAANPPEQSPGGQVLPPPIANRMVHLRWPSPTPPEWAAWFGGMAGKMANNVARIEAESAGRVVPASPVVTDADLRRVLAQTRITPNIVGYSAFVTALNGVAADVREFFATLGTQAHLEEKVADKTDEYLAGPWPSPRSWELAMRALAAAESRGLNDIGELLVASTIGEATATVFFAWRREKGRPPAEELLASVLAGNTLNALRNEPASDDSYIVNVIAVASNDPQQWAAAAYQWLAELLSAGYPEDRVFRFVVDLAKRAPGIAPPVAMARKINEWKASALGKLMV